VRRPASAQFVQSAPQLHPACHPLFDRNHFRRSARPVAGELATNAGKYGALSTDTGRVDVGWGADGDALTMSWTEREGPPVSAPKRRGFGTIVMEAMAERSVDGMVDLDYAPSGVTWRLTCPAANALKPGEREQNFRVRAKLS